LGEALGAISLPPSTPGGNRETVSFGDFDVDGSGNIYYTAVIPPNVDEPASCWVGNSQVCYFEGVGEIISSANPPASARLGFSQLLAINEENDSFAIAVDMMGNAYFTAPAAGNGQSSNQQNIVYRAALQPDNSYAYTQIGSSLVNPTALAADGLGNAYVLDSGAIPSPVVYEFDYADPPALSFANTGEG
jgi:hypothetical protein